MEALKTRIEESVDEIITLYKQYGHLHYGEGVTQLQHALQAVELAIAEDRKEGMVIATFLHDIGHLLSDRFVNNRKTTYGSVEHEYSGSHYLKEMGYSSYVIEMVESHVLAKRYLVATNPEYYDTLSEASKKTLEYQGGKLSIQGCVEFESNPNFNDYLTLRKYDDEAKENRISPINLEFMRGMLVNHLVDNLT